MAATTYEQALAAQCINRANVLDSKMATITQLLDNILLDGAKKPAKPRTVKPVEVYKRKYIAAELKAKYADLKKEAREKKRSELAEEAKQKWNELTQEAKDAFEREIKAEAEAVAATKGKK